MNQEKIDKLSILIKNIVESEISHGNKIVEISEGWTKSYSILVALKFPFVKTYQALGLEYRDIDDHHWWKAEYYDPETSHIVTCGF